MLGMESLANKLSKLQEKDLVDVGDKMYDLMKQLFPICRSITGSGVRETHEIISKKISLNTYEIPTGTQE